MKLQLMQGDSLRLLKELPDNSVDSIVTDPPYGLSFMGKKWDYDVPTTELWAEVFRVLKPGGHLLAFFGTRTYHRGVVRIEDAGFEIRDQIQWIYGSGFPKSHNLKDEWQGWGTALKPANEPIVVARKPLEKGLTVAENVVKWGTGAINIDGSRIGTEIIAQHQRDLSQAHGDKWAAGTKQPVLGVTNYTTGRWPANVLFDKEAAAMLEIQANDNVSRFFYVAKASKRERNAGLEGMPLKSQGAYGEFAGDGRGRQAEHQPTANYHPTVKPIKLMQYLIKLVTPPNGTVLDPFMGSGSTGVAAKKLGLNFVGIELSEEYFEISKARINKEESEAS